MVSYAAFSEPIDRYTQFSHIYLETPFASKESSAVKKLFRSFIFCISLLPLSVFALTLSQQDVQQIKQDIHTLQSAIETHDVESVLNLTHDSIFQKMASRETMQAVLVETYGKFEQLQVKVHDYQIGEFGQAYQAGDEIAVFVPTQTLMEIQQQKIQSTSYLLALKNRAGEWHYIDGSAFKQDPLQMWFLVPDLPTDVVVPPSEHKVITE